MRTNTAIWCFIGVVAMARQVQAVNPIQENMRSLLIKRAAGRKTNRKLNKNFMVQRRDQAPTDEAVCEAFFRDFFSLDDDLIGQCTCTRTDDKSKPAVSTFNLVCDFADCPKCDVVDEIGEEICVTDYYDVDYEFFYFEDEFNELRYKECLTYTSYFTGDQVCFEGYSTSGVGDFVSCSLDVNGAACDSCSEDPSCNDYTLDCSNLGYGVVSYCNNDEFALDSPLFLVTYNGEAFDTFIGDCIVGGPPSDGVVASSILGDTHIVTFDGVEYDCQAAGEFVLTQSSTMMIQGRFEAVQGAQASVTTGIAIYMQGLPTVEVSLPRIPDEICSAVLSIDGATGILESGDVIAFTDEHTISVTDDAIVLQGSGYEITLLRRQSASFNCFFSALIALPDTADTYSGLFGTPNGIWNDDWMMPSGEFLRIPRADWSQRFAAAYNFCVSWCIQSPQDSLFSYYAGSFAEYYRCNEPFDPALRQAINEVMSTQNSLTNICGTDLACLIEGLVGTEDDSVVYLQDYAISTDFRRAVGAPVMPPFQPPVAKGKGKGKSKGMGKSIGKGNKGKGKGNNSWSYRKGKAKGWSDNTKNKQTGNKSMSLSSATRIKQRTRKGMP